MSWYHNTKRIATIQRKLFLYTSHLTLHLMGNSPKMGGSLKIFVKLDILTSQYQCCGCREGRKLYELRGISSSAENS